MCVNFVLFLLKNNMNHRSNFCTIICHFLSLTQCLEFVVMSWILSAFKSYTNKNLLTSFIHFFFQLNFAELVWIFSLKLQCMAWKYWSWISLKTYCYNIDLDFIYMSFQGKPVKELKGLFEAILLAGVNESCGGFRELIIMMTLFCWGFMDLLKVYKWNNGNDRLCATEHCWMEKHLTWVSFSWTNVLMWAFYGIEA